MRSRAFPSEARILEPLLVAGATSAGAESLAEVTGGDEAETVTQAARPPAGQPVAGLEAIISRIPDAIRVASAIAGLLPCPGAVDRVACSSGRATKGGLAMRISLASALAGLGLSFVVGGWSYSVEAAEFRLQNACVDTARVALRYKDAATDEWRSAGWYRVEPGKWMRPTLGGRRLRTDNTVFYFYAATVDGKSVWAGKSKNKADRTYIFRGHEFRFREIRDAQGDRNLRLTCEERLPRPIGPPEPLCTPGVDPCCSMFEPQKWHEHDLFGACDWLPPA